MEIIFDIGNHKDNTIARDWKIDLSEPLPASIGDPESGFYLMNIRLEVAKPKVIVLCGSSRFVDIMAVTAWQLERDEHVIVMGLHLLPQWYAKDIPDHLAEHEDCAEQMDELHLRKIDISDEIFVVNWRGYIGESTAKEIAYAKELGKPIRYLESGGND